jgi:hypothetical protein
VLLNLYFNGAARRRARIPPHAHARQDFGHPTKPLSNQRDLSLAYSPGVAYPCLDIQADPSLAPSTPRAATWWA